jgi:hypothetical protein
MYRDPRLAALLLLSAAIACGGEELRAPEMTLAFREQALLEEVDRIAFFFYENNIECTPLRMMVPRPRSLLGPYLATLNDDSRMNGLVFTLNEVPAGTYVVLADALNADGTTVGTGCAQGQQVFDRQRSSITLTISRNP